MLVDTHCHLDFHQFDEDRGAVIERARAAGVMAMVTIGIDLPTSQAAIELAEGHEAIYATVGVHPNSVGGDLEATLKQLEAWSTHPKVVAVGECGLDYYWDKTAPAQQKEWFRAQLDLCARLDMPVVIHNRESTVDMIAILRDWQQPGVLHSFSGTWEQAQQVLDLGFYIGLTGPITFKKAEEKRRIAREAPLDRLLIETDAPYLTPQPYRGKRNEPAYVQYVAAKIAEVRGVDTEAIAQATTHNARTLFGL